MNAMLLALNIEDKVTINMVLLVVLILLVVILPRVHR